MHLFHAFVLRFLTVVVAVLFCAFLLLLFCFVIYLEMLHMQNSSSSSSNVEVDGLRSYASVCTYVCVYRNAYAYMSVCVCVCWRIYSCSRTIISRSTTFGFFDEPAAKAKATATAALERAGERVAAAG